MEADHDENDHSYESNDSIAWPRLPPPPSLPTGTPAWMSHISALPLDQLPRAPTSFAFGSNLSAEDGPAATSLHMSSAFHDYLHQHHPAYAPPVAPAQQTDRPREPSRLRVATSYYASAFPLLPPQPSDLVFSSSDASFGLSQQSTFSSLNQVGDSATPNGFSSGHSLWQSPIDGPRLPPIPQDVEFQHDYSGFQPVLGPDAVQSNGRHDPSPTVEVGRVFPTVESEDVVDAEDHSGETAIDHDPVPSQSQPSRKRKNKHDSPTGLGTNSEQVSIKQKKPRKSRSQAISNSEVYADLSAYEGPEKPSRSRKEPKGRGRAKGQRIGPRPVLDPGPEFMTLYNQAMDAFIEQDDVFMAQTKVLQAIGINPEIFAAHSLLADIHFAKGDHDKGLDALIGGLHAHMNDAELWRQVADTILLGNQEAPQKRIERAMYCFGGVLRKDPKDMDARFQRAECARLLGHVNRAFSDLNILLQDDPHNSSVLAQFTQLCSDINDVPKAKLMYDEHFEYYRINGISEEDCFTWQDVGIYVDLLTQAGEIAQAIVLLKRLSRWLCGRRDEDFWEEHLEDDREFDQNHYPRRLDVSQFEPHKYPENDYGEALPLDLRAKLGILRLRLNYREEAQSHFDWLEPDLEEEESLIGEYSDTFLEVARALFDAKEHKDALRFYSALEDAEIELGFEFWIDLGASAYVCEQRQKAIKAYNQALTVNPGSIEARTQLAKLYRDLGDRPNALKYGREAVVMSQDAIPQTGNRKYENKESRLLREAAERALKGAYRLPIGPHGVPGKIPDSLKYRTRMKSKFFKYIPRATGDSADEEDTPHPKKGRLKKFGPPKRSGRIPNPAKASETNASTIASSSYVPAQEGSSKLKAPGVTKKKPSNSGRKQPSRIDPQKRYEDVQALYQNLIRNQSCMREGDEEATGTWIECAQAMVDDFRAMKEFFPGERHQKFRGYDQAPYPGRPQSKKPPPATDPPIPSQSAQAVIPDTSTAMNDSRSPTPVQMVEPGISNDYCGIPFSVWLDIFLELALIIANSATSRSSQRDLQSDCYSVINAAIDCNVFFHHSPSLAQIHIVYLSCCLALNDDVTLYNTVLRWFMNEFTFCTDTYRLYSTVALLGEYSNIEGKSRIEGSMYRDSSNQKFLFRQLCSIDQQLPKDYGIGTSYGPVPGFMRRERNGLRVQKGKNDEDQDGDKESAQPVMTPVVTDKTPARPEHPRDSVSEATPITIPRRDRLGNAISIKNFSPQEMDVVLFILYSHIMMANNSFTNALNYLYRAHSLDPTNTVCLLSMAFCYLHELFKRQCGNRHALSLMGWMWFGRYEVERRKWAERIDEQDRTQAVDEEAGTKPSTRMKAIDLVNREIAFNKARCWEMLGMPDLAVRGYKKLLTLPSTKKERVEGVDPGKDDDEEEEPETWDMEAAYALSTIYMINGDGQMARQIAEKYMVVE